MGAWSEWLQAVAERSPERARWLVRVFRNKDDPKAVGVGVLVNERHVLTCAHVAAKGPGPERVWVDFPFVAPSERKEATLTPDGWRPRTSDGRGDLALFDLATLPRGAAPARLRHPGRVSGHKFRAYGFPPGHPDGDWARGEILGDAGPGHIQLEVETGHVIEAGFSGAPVWDDDLGAVIGLVATAEPGARRSFLIPVTEVSRHWSNLLDGWVGWRASQDPAFLGHWLDRALGSAAAGERDGHPVSLFCGRDEAMREINRWMEGLSEGRVKVVTGMPGTGKSALLSRLVVLADPAVRCRLDLTDSESATAPRPFAFDVAVHARRRSLGEVASAIAQATGGLLDVSPEEWAHPEEAAARAVAAIAGAPRRSTGGLTVAVDALDEADRPHDLARLLLEPLARQDDVQVVVATRPGDGDSLLRALGADPSGAMVLQDSPWFSLEHLAGYVRTILVAIPGSPYAGQSAPLVTEVARAVAKKAVPSYLVAGLTARTLARASLVADRQRLGWDEEFPGDVDGAMGAYLDSMADPLKVRELLLPLAYARGFGLPADGRLWARLAVALTGRPYVVGDVAGIRRSAADYLMEEIGRDRPTIRLFHQALADALLRERADQRADEADIARAVWEPRPGEPRTVLDDGYSRAHLADHAAAGGVLDDYLVDPGFLVSAEPPRLLTAITAAPPYGRPARRWADIYEYAAPRLSEDVAANASYLEQAIYHLGHRHCIDAIRQVNVERPFTTLWATTRLVAPHRIHVSHETHIQAVAIGLHRGKTLVASGGSDGTVRIWDPDHSDVDPIVLRAHEHWIQAVAVGLHRGKTLIASGGQDGTVRLWDPDVPGREMAVLRGHRAGVEGYIGSGVNGVAIGLHHGKTLVVSGGSDGTVRLWDPDRPEADPVVLRGHKAAAKGRLGGVMVVAVAVHRAKTLVVSGGSDGTVRLWDPDRPEADPVVLRSEGSHGVNAVSVAVHRAKTLIVIGGWSGTIRLWDADHPEADPIALRSSETGETVIEALSVGLHGDKTLIVSGGRDGTVRLWEADNPDAERLVFRGHEDHVETVAIGLHRGKTLVASGGWDGTVRLWEPDGQNAETAVFRGHEDRVRTVAIGLHRGKTLVASGGGDGTVRLWEPDGQDAETAVLRGHTAARKGENYGGVETVAIGLHRGKTLVASGGGDGTVRLWDLDRLEADPVVLRTGEDWVQAVAVGVHAERTLVVSGGAGGTVRLWDPDRPDADSVVLRGHKPRRKGTMPGGVEALAIGLHRGKTLIVSGGWDGTVRLWDPDRPSVKAVVLRGHERPVCAVAVAVHRAKTLVVSGGWDRTIRLWDVEGSRADPVVLQGHKTGVEALAIGLHRGRTFVVSGDRDGTVRFWDVDAGQLVQAIRFPGLTALAWQGGNSIVVGTPTGLDLVKVDSL